MEAGDKDELPQIDLSNLRIEDMTPLQRAELRRRYDAFVRHFDAASAKPSAGLEASKKHIRKWIPGAKQ
jgi:hypothetical protein